MDGQEPQRLRCGVLDPPGSVEEQEARVPLVTAELKRTTRFVLAHNFQKADDD